MSAATSLLDQVLIIERHLQHAVDLLGDQPFSDHPAWTYSLVSVSSPDGVEEVIEPVRLAFLVAALDGVNGEYPELARRVAVLPMVGSAAVNHFADGLLDAVVDVWMQADRGDARAEVEEALD